MSKSLPNRHLKPWLSQKVVVKNPSIDRRGLFAKEKINQQEVVSKYGGQVVSSLKAWLSHLFVGDFDWQIEKNLFIIPLSKREIFESSLFNHSCDPNLGCKGQRTIIATRPIKKGEELTADYAMIATNEPYHYLPFLPDYKFKCRCQSKNCRKIITGDDWKKKDLQFRYKGYFTPYLQRKIENLARTH